MYRVTLTFVVDDEDEAWDIAEALEKAGMARNYREVSGFVEPASSRGGVLAADESSAVLTSAESLERRSVAGPAMTLGSAEGEMMTLGDEHGNSG